MKNILVLLTFFVVSFSINAQGQYFHFSSIPELPPNPGRDVQLGLAGMYIGIDDDVLIAAGGANFPGQMPWAAGVKAYYNDIFILRKRNGNYSWEVAKEKLPFASAYGGAVNTPLGLLCFGGNTADNCISQSWFIDYLPGSGEVKIKPGPTLPSPLTNFAFAELNGSVYVAGGSQEIGGSSSKHFWRLELETSDPSRWMWETLPSWEGKPRSYAVGVAQSNGATNCFYLFSGRNVQAGNQAEILYDGHVFNPSLGKWFVISKGVDRDFPFTAGSAVPVGAATILITAGDDGEQTDRQRAIETNIASFQRAGGKQGEIDSLRNELFRHLENHPGFGTEMSVFNTITHQTHSIQTGSKEQVTTTAVNWGDDIILPSGEIRPGVRTPNVLKISISREDRQLGAMDVIVIALYFIILAWMGYYFSKRQKNTNDYFKGGGRIPWWAAGLSIFGTSLSSITFMAIPSKTYATDWSYFVLNMTIFLVAPIIVFVVIPFYRKLNITTAYEYLETRFNLTVRLLGTLSFILFQIGRMGVVLFLPAIALNVVTNIDIFLCIGLMGIVSLVYTMMGGIEAVVWTDVMQVIVLLGGALLSLALIILAVDGGVTSVIETAAARNKFNLFDLDWSLRQPTVWVMLMGGIFANITTYATDQTMVQRYLTTKSMKEAKQSVWTNAYLAIPATFIFFFIGTSLFAFYKSHPQELNPTLASNDSIFPWFIASELPDGVSGFLIAGIFAAAMSTLSSSMNSVATAYSTDIHFRFGWSKGLSKLNIAKSATIAAGLVGTLFAFMMATMEVQSLWDEFQKVLGLVIGSLGGVFILGMVSRTANAPGALIGIAISIVVQILIGTFKPVHLLLYASSGFISCFVIGYLASFLFKKPNLKKTLAGYRDLIHKEDISYLEKNS